MKLPCSSHCSALLHLLRCAALQDIKGQPAGEWHATFTVRPSASHLPVSMHECHDFSQPVTPLTFSLPSGVSCPLLVVPSPSVPCSCFAPQTSDFRVNMSEDIAVWKNVRHVIHLAFWLIPLCTHLAETSATTSWAESCPLVWGACANWSTCESVELACAYRQLKIGENHERCCRGGSSRSSMPSSNATWRVVIQATAA